MKRELLTLRYCYYVQESADFIDAEQTMSKVTTLNKILEDDDHDDDVIGDYNLYQFKPSDLVGNTDYTEFRHDKHNYVRLTLTITPVTTSKSALNEYVLEGMKLFTKLVANRTIKDSANQNVNCDV